MAKIQPCRNGCGQLITVAEHEGRWKPFNVSEDGTVQALHDCPNSTWNKNKAAQQPAATTAGAAGGGWTGTTKGGQMFEARVSQGLQMAQTSINEVILKMLGDINRKLDEHTQNVLKLFDNQLQQALKQDENRERLEAVANNVLEILGLLQDQFIKEHGPENLKTEAPQEEPKFKDLTDEEIKKIADTERIDEAPKHDGSDYGF